MPEDRAKEPEARIIRSAETKRKGGKQGMEQRPVEHKQKGLIEHIIGAPDRGEAILEEIMSEKFSKLVEDISQIQDAQRIIRKINTKENTPGTSQSAENRR